MNQRYHILCFAPVKGVKPTYILTPFVRSLKYLMLIINNKNKNKKFKHFSAQDRFTT